MSRRPRILFLITLAETGGAQTYISLLLPALSDRYDVIVAAHGPGPLRDAAHAAGARFVSLRQIRRAVHPLRDLLGLVELIRLCRRERPDVMHANSSKIGVLGRIAAALTRVPVRVFTVHGWAFAAYGGAASRLYLWADRIVRPLTTVVVCVAENDRTRGLAAGTCTPERTVVISNAVDVGAAPQARLRGAGPPQIVSVGRFKYPKDFVTLLHALARIKAQHRTIVVGDGPDRSHLEALAAKLGLGERLELAGERRDVAELLAASDVFVLSSRSEGMPVSVLEAMAVGLPVVASQVGGVPEIVVDDETGLLVPPGDACALAEALGRLLGDPELRHRLGVSGRRRAEELYDLPRFRAAHLELYERELARVARGR